ncbi:MAG: electron transport complex subunit RsxC [Xanthomonadales bacterium]|nr:electron transport complex subunit RsxC [Xanthomonadales bacterium]
MLETEQPLRVGHRLWHFHGGLKLRHWKKISMESPLTSAGLPDRLELPLRQNIGEVPMVAVQPGDRVLKGQQLTRTNGSVSAHIHAPASGVVTEIGTVRAPHPSGLEFPGLVIEPDGTDGTCYQEPISDWLNADPNLLLDRVFHSGIVGLGGALFPTHAKLRRSEQRPVEVLVLNGAECEPYISCDETLMRDRPREIIRGACIMRHMLNARQCVIAIEDQMGVVEQVLRDALEELGMSDQALVVKVPTIYPEGGEKQLIRVLTGREVPSGGLPMDVGVVCQNVATAAATYRAVALGEPLMSRIVSVTGRGVQQPCNVEALLGTPISRLTAAAGGYTDQAQRLIMGGPMMGLSLPDDDLPVTKATNCVLVLTHRDVSPVAPELPCIRCGECARVCPAQLQPQQLLWHIRASEFDQAEDLSLADCIECGCCAFVCPSQIPLVDYYRYGKTENRVRAADRQRAEHSKQRLDARNIRLEAQKKQRKERLARKQKALAEDGKKSEIEAAVARSKARRAQRDPEA